MEVAMERAAEFHHFQWFEDHTQQEKEIKLGAVMIGIFCVNKLCSETRFACIRVVFGESFRAEKTSGVIKSSL